MENIAIHKIPSESQPKNCISISGFFSLCMATHLGEVKFVYSNLLSLIICSNSLLDSSMINQKYTTFILSFFVSTLPAEFSIK